MTHVECPREGCPGVLQEPFRVPNTRTIHPPFCRLCDTKWPKMTKAFDQVVAGEGGGKPEETLRYGRNELWAMLGFHVYDLEQGHRPGPGGTRQTLGLPDTLLFGHGLQVWIEYKDTGRKQTEHQVTFQERAEANGGLYFVVWPETVMKDILEELQRHPDWRADP